MAMLQAMACGVPVVAARCGGLTEHVPAEVGLLAEPGQPEQFREKLAWLLGNENERRHMGAAASERVQGYSIGAIVDIWEGVYSEALLGARVRNQAPAHAPAEPTSSPTPP